MEVHISITFRLMYNYVIIFQLHVFLGWHCAHLYILQEAGIMNCWALSYSTDYNFYNNKHTYTVLLPLQVVIFTTMVATL